MIAYSLLTINFTPQGGRCFPLLIHGNTVKSRLDRSKLRVFGRPADEETTETQINAMASWVHRRERDEAWSYLEDAFDAVANGNFSHSLLPAHSAVELSLMPLAWIPMLAV